MNENKTGLILLTYKNKALLMYKYETSIDEEKHEWSFLRAIRIEKESLKEALTKVVFKEAGIKIENIKYLSRNFYYAELTDKNVNGIKRKELQLLDFFKLDEIRKLNLSQSTRELVIKHGNLI